MNEIWKDIKGYDGLYQVSNFGRVKSFKWGKEKILRPGDNGRGYLCVGLSLNKKLKSERVHRLVAEAFIPNPLGLKEVNHKDENKHNNHVDNLEWCSHEYNMSYGTQSKRAAEKNVNGKCSKPVLQYTIDGVFVKEYPSLCEAERKTGYAQANISSCCKGRYKHAYGYIWRYKKDTLS